MERARLVALDLLIAAAWTWSGSLTRLLCYGVLSHHPAAGEMVKCSLYVCWIFFFKWVGKVTRGASGNSLTVLVRSLSDDLDGLSFTLLVRIPAQVCGAIIGVMFITLILPEFTYGTARPNVGIPRGALTEGLLAFTITSVSLALAKYDPENFFIRTWIYSVSRLALRILGSDLTGGIMNPASASGWAFVLGKQNVGQHLFVYWIAPFQATFLAVWMFRRLNRHGQRQQRRPQFMVSVPVPRRLDSSSRILSRRTTRLR